MLDYSCLLLCEKCEFDYANLLCSAGTNRSKPYSQYNNTNMQVYVYINTYMNIDIENTTMQIIALLAYNFSQNNIK